MDIETFRDYCLNKKGVTESLPFDENTLVFKVLSKVFAITNLTKKPLAVNLKCDPERAIELRELYSNEITPGYHMNKKHWNTVIFESDLPINLLNDLIDHSYKLVISKMTKKEKATLIDDL